MPWRGPIKYCEMFQMVPDSYSVAAELSSEMAIGCNGNLDTD